MLCQVTSGRSFVASYYAPITLTPSPVILFKVEEDGSVTLLSTGSTLSCDPDRVICKRAVLSGHPLKINKRTATVRYLFHNREDIAYFRPLEVRTKQGRRGHIKEALGTHGHCKIGFDGPLHQNDTVIMCLYKRSNLLNVVLYGGAIPQFGSRQCDNSDVTWQCRSNLSALSHASIRPENQNGV
eukprot:sb/3471481/